MTTVHHQRVKEIFHAASECDSADRPALLDRMCGEDQALREEVESLLEHLEAPVVNLDGAAQHMRQLLKSASELKPGPRPATLERLGDYRILSVLGEGGMGIVYLAEQDKPRRTVALKVIRTGVASQSMLRRFEHETQVLGRLQHPGIAQIFEAGTADTGHGAQPYFAMEYVRGRSLTEFAEHKKLGTRERLRLLIKVCQAIQHAHHHGVIHRDLKPSNILVEDASGEPQPKILDFGIARSTNTDVQTTTLRTDIGQLVGTLPYMSPEQVAGDANRLDVRADVYALGVILYELLAGRLPHDLKGKSMPEAMRIIQSDEPTPLSSVSRFFRGDLATIAGKALEKDPERRYQSALELALDLQRYLDDQPIIARPASHWYQFSKFARRNRTLVSTVCLTMLGLLCAAVVSIIFLMQAMIDRDLAEMARGAEEVARRVAEEKTKQADAKTAEAQWQAHLANIAAADSAFQANDLATARRRLEMIDARHQDSWEFRHLWSRLDESVQALRHGDVLRQCVHLSPDCRRLLAPVWDRKVTIWDLGTTVPPTEYEIHDGPVLEAKFNSAGDRFVSCSADKTVRIVDADNGTIHHVLAGHTDRVNSCAFSPDDRFVASGGADDVARIWDAQTGQLLHVLKGHEQDINQVAFSPNGKLLLTASEDRTYRLWSVDTGECRSTVNCGSGRVASAAFSPDGSLLATGHEKREIQIWSVADGTQRAVLRGHTHSVLSVCFSPDGRRLVSGSRDSTLRIWDVEKAKELRVLRGHTSEVQAVMWGADGWTIASCGNSGHVFLWDAAIADDPDILWGHERPVLGLAFSGDGSTLVSMADDGTIRFWDWRAGKELASLPCGKTLPAAMVASLDGNTVIASDAENRLQVIDVGSRSVAKRLEGVGSNVAALALSADKRWLAIGGHEKAFKVVEVDSGRVVLDLPKAIGRCCGMSFTPDGRFLIVAFNERKLQWLSTDTWQESRVVDLSGRLTLSMCMTSDGSLVAVSDVGGRVWMFDVGSGEQRGPVLDTPSAVAEMRFTRDGQRLVTSNSDGRVWFWDVQTGDEVLTLRSRTYPGYGMAFGPDERVLAAGSIDVSIRLWETRPIAEHLQAIRHERSGGMTVPSPPSTGQ